MTRTRRAGPVAVDRNCSESAIDSGAKTCNRNCTRSHKLHQQPHSKYYHGIIQAQQCGLGQVPFTMSFRRRTEAEMWGVECGPGGCNLKCVGVSVGEPEPEGAGVGAGVITVSLSVGTNGAGPLRCHGGWGPGMLSGFRLYTAHPRMKGYPKPRKRKK